MNSKLPSNLGLGGLDALNSGRPDLDVRFQVWPVLRRPAKVRLRPDVIKDRPGYRAQKILEFSRKNNKNSKFSIENRKLVCKTNNPLWRILRLQLFLKLIRFQKLFNFTEFKQNASTMVQLA